MDVTVKLQNQPQLMQEGREKELTAWVLEPTVLAVRSEPRDAATKGAAAVVVRVIQARQAMEVQMTAPVS
jgi:hypothetical protein